MSLRWRRLLLVLVSLTLVAAACGDDDSADSADTTTAPSSTPEGTEAPAETTEVPADTTEAPADATTTAAPETTTTAPAETTTTAAPEVLTILVTNDDGVGAPGVDALVNALLELPDVEVTVVAPAENQSGTSMSLSEGELATSEATTASGYPAISVEGFPADTVAWALANLDTDFDLVVSGSNSGQNFGPLHVLSGTVGAARYAAQQGLPAVAVSQGIAEIEDFPASVDPAVDWIEQNRDAYEAGEVSLHSVNAPSCPNGTRGVVEAPLATDWNGREAAFSDCDSTLTDPVDDVDAFANGFAVITELPIEI